MNINLILNFIFFNLKLKKKKLIVKKINNIRYLKKKIASKQYNILAIEIKKNKIFKIISLFSFLLKKKIYKKNFFILYKFKTHLKMYNFLPDWTGNYINQPYHKNLILWFKIFFSILYYRKFIEYFIFTKNDNTY
jgi:hypothetical protein